VFAEEQSALQLEVKWRVVDLLQRENSKIRCGNVVVTALVCIEFFP
jgi:hypothetical protein